MCMGGCSGKSSGKSAQKKPTSYVHRNMGGSRPSGVSQVGKAKVTIKFSRRTK